MPTNNPHRIDTAQHAVPASKGPVRLRGRKAVSVGWDAEKRDQDGSRETSVSPRFTRKITPSSSPVSLLPSAFFGDTSGQRPKIEQSASNQHDHSSANDPEHWLRAHATDLIQHLQTWSGELDQRESSLNARIALHERRERQFRVQRSELSQQLADGQARVEELRQQLEARTRRLAFEEHS